MKRKSILTGGILLSIVYSLMVVGTVALGLTSIVYFFVGESVQLINDLFLPIIKPYLIYGKGVMLIFVALTIFVSIFLVTASTRFMKYSSANSDLFEKKKNLLLFYLVCIILAFGVFCFLLINNITIYGFTSKLLFNILLCITIIIHIISCVMIILGISHEPSPVSNKSSQLTSYDSMESIKPSKPAIYTAGLEEETAETKKEINVTKEIKQDKEINQPEKIEESESSKKLIEGISKLDKMRQEGAISPEEYTRLRMQMIKKYVK